MGTSVFSVPSFLLPLREHEPFIKSSLQEHTHISVQKVDQKEYQLTKPLSGILNLPGKPSGIWITIWLNPYHDNQSFQLSILAGVTNPCEKYELVLILIGNTNPHSEYQFVGEKGILIRNTNLLKRNEKKVLSIVPNKTRQEIQSQNCRALIWRISRFPIWVFCSLNTGLNPWFSKRGDLFELSKLP